MGAWGSRTSMITFLRLASDVKFSVAGITSCGHNLGLNNVSDILGFIFCCSYLWLHVPAFGMSVP